MKDAQRNAKRKMKGEKKNEKARYNPATTTPKCIS